jgi:hypothetical protein
MSLVIENPKIEALAQQLANQENKTIEQIIAQALENHALLYEQTPRPIHSDSDIELLKSLKLRKKKKRTEEERQAMLAEMNLIAKECAALPDLTDLSADEILGYDENGLPK